MIEILGTAVALYLATIALLAAGCLAAEIFKVKILHH